MFSEVDFRQELNSDEKVDSAYSQYHPTRFLVQFYTFLILCGFLLSLYFWINPEAFPKAFSNAHSPRNNAPAVRFQNRQQAARIRRAQDSQMERVRENERFTMGVAIVGIGIAYLVVFLELMSRFHKNAVLFKEGDLDISRRFFLFSWFIPFANLYFPFRTIHSILHLSGSRRDRESSSDRLLFAYWVSVLVTYLMISSALYFQILMGDIEPRYGGGTPLTFRIIEAGNSVVGVVLLTLIIYRIDRYQRVRAKKGPEYDRPFACVSCGETVSISQGQYPMCGRKIPIGGAAEM